jgi:hypothetical protein
MSFREVVGGATDSGVAGNKEKEGLGRSWRSLIWIGKRMEILNFRVVKFRGDEKSGIF